MGSSHPKPALAFGQASSRVHARSGWAVARSRTFAGRSEHRFPFLLSRLRFLIYNRGRWSTMISAHTRNVAPQSLVPRFYRPITRDIPHSGASRPSERVAQIAAFHQPPPDINCLAYHAEKSARVHPRGLTDPFSEQSVLWMFCAQLSRIW